MKKKELFMGIILIAIAIYAILSKIQIIPELPVFTIFFTALFAYLSITGIFKRNIFRTLMPLALIGCMYDTQLGITQITPGPLLISTLLVCIGLKMIAKNLGSDKYREWGYSTRRRGDRMGASGYYESEDGSNVSIENNFSSSSRYIHSKQLKKAMVETNFGNNSIYFNDVELGEEPIEIVVKNNFGETNLYIPSDWILDMKREVSFGYINNYRKAETIENNTIVGKHVNLHLEASFGCINVYDLVR